MSRSLSRSFAAPGTTGSDAGLSDAAESAGDVSTLFAEVTLVGTRRLNKVRRALCFFQEIVMSWFKYAQRMAC